MKTFILYWLAPILWCTIIYAQSSFATPDVVPHWHYFDKLMHAGGYGLLGFLLCRALTTVPGLRGSPPGLVLGAALLSALYGLSDEWHQSFVPERTADAADLLADLIGGLAGGMLYLWASRKLRSLSSSKSS